MLETREAKSAVLGKGERVCTLCMGKERGKRQVLEGKYENKQVYLFFFGQSRAISLIRKGLNKIRSVKFGNSSSKL